MENLPVDKTPPQKPLGDLIAEKVGVLHPQHTAREAADKMREMDTDVLPVAEERKLVGMMTGKFADRELGGRGHDPSETRVGEQMSREIVYCFEDQDRSEAERIMKEKNLRYLPVVDKELRIIGIIKREDIEN